jgi:hypothetical protein
MKPRFGTIALLLLLAGITVFVWRTSRALPPIVASHFAASGAADGFMPRATYMVVLLLLVVGAPLLVAFLPSAVVAEDGGNLKIPSRRYWLAPERRQETVAFILGHGKWFSAALALFLAYVHWLVVQANQLQPPILSTSAMVSGLVAFFAALVAWLVVLFRRFRVRV